ncbi:MAG TPA: M20 family metallopeptidase [Streptosporangiaceae bacterium]|jgi:amidohydrolase
MTGIDPRIAEEFDALLPRMRATSRRLHAHPETAWEEHAAADLLTGWLAEEGFAVERPYAGVETGFRARRPGHERAPATIAVLLEYDALPGIGHACGHNLIAAGGAAAAIAAARALGDAGAAVTVIGTPAEEGGGGKIVLLDRGAFDDVDAALMFHPADRTLTARHGLAAIHFHAEFRGVASHAAKHPEDGKSAFNGARLFFDAIDMLRQFLPAKARIHGIIRAAGDAPNVVPDHALVEGIVRARTLAEARDLFARVRRIAEGAAMGSETTAEVREPSPAYAERRNNPAMVAAVDRYLRAQAVDITPTSPDNPAGSSDIGNVSLVVPAIHPYIQIAERGTPSHAPVFAEAAGTDYAFDQAAKMARAIACTVADLAADPDLRAAVRESFEADDHAA